MGWNRESIAAALESEIRRMAGVSMDDEEFGRDVHIFDYGYVDSFGAVDLVSFTEKTFGIRIPNDDLANIPLNTVNEMTAYVARRIGVA
jgi:methoxymalonate biosynthesis acyl carrier protein